MPVVMPSDVASLQARVRAQRDAIQFAIGACPAAKADAVLMAQWDAEDLAVNAFLADAPSWISTAAQMDAGEQIQRDLTQWLPRLAAKGCANVPPKPEGPPETGLQQAGHFAIEVAEAAAVLVGLFLVVQLARRKR